MVPFGMFWVLGSLQFANKTTSTLIVICLLEYHVAASDVTLTGICSKLFSFLGILVYKP